MTLCTRRRVDSIDLAAETVHELEIQCNVFSRPCAITNGSSANLVSGNDPASISATQTFKVGIARRLTKQTEYSLRYLVTGRGDDFHNSYDALLSVVKSRFISF